MAALDTLQGLEDDHQSEGLVETQRGVKLAVELRQEDRHHLR